MSDGSPSPSAVRTLRWTLFGLTQIVVIGSVWYCSGAEPDEPKRAIGAPAVAPPKGQHFDLFVSQVSIQDMLSAIAGAQHRFRSRKILDADGDGNGEYGTVAQLAGEKGLLPPEGWSLHSDGYILSSGFRILAHLGATADDAEAAWKVYAWPHDVEEKGGATFFLRPRRAVIHTKMEETRYGGDTAPAADAAEGATPKDPRGRDGNRWVSWP